MHHGIQYRRRPRLVILKGFTLIELMVVISIIAVLITIGGMVIANSIAQAKERATRALLMKLDGLLQQRLDGFGTLLAKPQRQTELQTKGVAIVNSKLSAANIVGVPNAM